MTTLFDQISQDIVAAMKAKDKVRLEALRNVKKYFIEAKTAPGANDELSDDAALKILAKLVKQGRDTAALYTEQQRPDLAEAELAQVAVIEAYLPKALTPEELEAALRSIIAETGATSAKEMGKVMGVATKRLAGRADGKAISTLVRQLLA
ncbi:MAG: GatB/YqeY domain-containing protein [Bacteroidales bacterium]|nr:GatB/YqeY domain-containing protein [Bacteroidales bacterium]MCI7316121.1 GatB/YqeY domain-containing protein [Bacteroidales bacterium]MEE0904653.1 GatB/YqeY domain-containing protein [Prevotellamassilia sp.]